MLATRDSHSQYQAVLNTERRRYDYLWIAVAQLLEIEYWTRSWILQELVLARRTWFLCGSDITDLEILALALYGAKWRHERVLEQPGSPDRDKALRRTDMVKMYLKLRTKKQSAEAHRMENSAVKEEDEREIARIERLLRWKPTISLPYLMNEKTPARLESSVVHDQVFSLLGLRDDPSSLIPEPSYDTPFHTLMQGMYQRLPETTISLDWIRLSGGNEPVVIEDDFTHSIGAVSLDDDIDRNGVAQKPQRITHYEKI